jgi:hypothetical protein
VVARGAAFGLDEIIEGEVEMRKKQNRIAVEPDATSPAGEAIAITSGADNDTLFQESRNKPLEPSRIQWMSLSESPLGFWNAPEEDIYTEADGEPI